MSLAPIRSGGVLRDGFVDLPKKLDVLLRDGVALRREDEQLVPRVLLEVILGGNSIEYC